MKNEGMKKEREIRDNDKRKQSSKAEEEKIKKKQKIHTNEAPEKSEAEIQEKTLLI